MKRTLTTWLVSLLAVGVAWAGETSLKVTGPDGLVGSATLVNKVQTDGTKYVRLTMKLAKGSEPATDVLQESSYNGKGEPVRMLQTTKNGPVKTSVVVTFTAEGAQVIADHGDGPKTNMVVNPAGSTANPSEFWFVGKAPKTGDSFEYFMFRLSDQSWQKSKVKFVGKQDIVVGGKRVSANLVQSGEAKAFLDDKGDPYRIEVGGLTLERAS